MLLNKCHNILQFSTNGKWAVPVKQKSMLQTMHAYKSPLSLSSFFPKVSA